MILHFDTATAAQTGRHEYIIAGLKTFHHIKSLLHFFLQAGKCLMLHSLIFQINSRHSAASLPTLSISRVFKEEEGIRGEKSIQSLATNAIEEFLKVPVVCEKDLAQAAPLQ